MKHHALIGKRLRSFSSTSGIPKERRDVSERGAALLLAKETLLEDDLKALIAPEKEASRTRPTAQPSIAVVAMTHPTEVVSERHA